MPSVVICDDESLHRDYTRQLVLRELEDAPELLDFASGEALLAAVTGQGLRPDIAILDIRLTGEDGILLAQRLNALVPHCQIIFLTAYLNYAPDAYDAQHVYFILKSQMESRMGPALRRALAALSLSKPPCLRVLSQDGVLLLPIEDIFLLERCGRRTRIASATGERWTAQTPQELLEEAAAEERFIRCHQSYWVNRRKIRAMRKNEFSLLDGSFAPLGRSYRQDARNEFLSTLRQELPELPEES